MHTYILRRLLLMIPTLLGITIVVFSVMAIAPGGTVPPQIRQALDSEEGLDSEAKQAMLKEMNRLYGLNDPVPLQYLRWLNNVSPIGWASVTDPEDDTKNILISPQATERQEETGELVVDPDSTWPTWLPGFKYPYLGRSFINNRPVTSLIWERVWITILLNLISIPLIYAVSVIIGIYAARHRGGAFDVASGGVMLAFWSIPVMWAGVMFIGFCCNVQYFHWFPASGLHDAQADQMFFLPHASSPVLAVALIVGALLPFVWLIMTQTKDAPWKRTAGALTVLVGAGWMVYLIVTVLSPGYQVVWLLVLGLCYSPVLIEVYRSKKYHVSMLWVAAGAVVPWGFLMGTLMRMEEFHRGWLLDSMWHLFLPVVCLTYTGFAFLTKLTRTSVLENILADYSRTARAKGVSENRILWQHVFRNSLLPLITVASALLPALLAGSVVVETIFSIDGMGQLVVEAVMNRDRELVLSITLVSGLLTLISYLIADICYAIADPRVSYE